MKRFLALIFPALFAGALVTFPAAAVHAQPVWAPGPPPPPVREHYVARRGFIWVAGHHRWVDGRWVWVPGHYVGRRPGMHWVAGRYQHGPHGWIWIEGHWR